jgi:phosphatidylglycerophosphate synthase
MQPATLAGARPDAPAPAESYRDVLRRLRSAQKPAGRGAPAYSIYVNRPIGRRIAAVAFRLGLTPNQVTAASAAFSLVAIALLALVPSSWALGALIAVLLAAGYAFDSADGQLARLRGGGSAAGEWLDHVVDAVKVVALHSAVLIAAARFLVPADQRGWLLLPIAFTIVNSVSFAVFLLNDLLRAARLRTETTAVIRGGSTPLRALLGLPTDYGLLIWVFVLLGSPVLFLGAYGLLLLASTAYLVLALPKWFRDMSALDTRSEPAL